MKFVDNIKKIIAKGGNKGKVIGLIALAIGNIASVVSISIAWFSMGNSDGANIAMVTGDVNVEIMEVSAYKYIYPYYSNSAEFIDYKSPGVVKNYTIENHRLTYEEESVDNITISSATATISLGSPEAAAYSTSETNLSASKIHYPSAGVSFTYYLVGDGVFCGEETHAWSVLGGLAFAKKTPVSNNDPAVLENVVVSTGAKFILFDKNGINTGNTTYSYLKYDGISEQNTAFRLLNDGSIMCLRSGIYNFTYNGSSLTIQKIEKRNAVISNNSLDPTLITIEYAGSGVPKTPQQGTPYYGDLNAYIPTAIKGQETMLVLDVKLNYKNVNPIKAGLKIERNNGSTTAPSNAIKGDYSNTTKNLDGVTKQRENPLLASDFYAFNAVLTKEATKYNSATAAWEAMHNHLTDEVIDDGDPLTDDRTYTTFNNTAIYDAEKECKLHTKENTDSLIIDSSNIDNIYHCYIAIEYDYVFSRYFFDKNRLGNTYLLYRDFTFHFTATQELES